MTGRTARTMGIWILALLGGSVLGASPVGDAVALYKTKHFGEAQARLERLVAAEPTNAEATYYLGMSAFRAGGPQALDTARTWLAKAVKLAPGNPDYLAQYAGVCLLMADRDSSLSLALEGRDAMTRAIAGNPADLEAREGLMRFYAKAPWPLGDAGKALDQAAEITRRDRRRGTAAYQSLVAVFTRAGRKEAAVSADQAAQSLARSPPQ